jgi:preprotein translocase subunit SecF
MKTFNIIGYSKIWLVISGALIVLSILSTLIFGLNFGIDFTGGSLIEIKAANSSVDQLRGAVESVGKEAVVQAGEGDLYFVRMQTITEGEHQTILGAIKSANADATETRFDSVGPTIGDELKRASVWAIIILLTLIGAYIAWAFRKVSEPVESWKYGALTAVAAFHDVIIPIGVFAILGKVLGYQIDTAFVAAMLTILGYSINDTIVVFDRTRENLYRHRHADKSFGAIVNQSVAETMARSLNTTFTTLLPLVAIFLVGGETTRPFVLALIVGILSGAYSSIFVASPLLVLWDKWSRRK